MRAGEHDDEDEHEDDEDHQEAALECGGTPEARKLSAFVAVAATTAE